MQPLAVLATAYFCTSIAAVFAVTAIPALQSLASYGKTSVAHTHGRFTVQHALFWHYYVSASIVATAALAHCAWRPVPALLVEVGPVIDMGSPQPVVAAVLASSLLLLQVLRRLYESIFVAVPSQARMHILHYLVGHAFYVAASAAAVGNCGPALVREGPPHLGALVTHVQHNRTLLAIAFSVFVAASVEQSRAHITLARLRAPGKPAYSVPRSGLFRLIVAPHYTCEIFIYVAIAIVGQSRLLWLCVIAVIVMLSTAAKGTDEWGKRTFGPSWGSRALLLPRVW